MALRFKSEKIPQTEVSEYYNSFTAADFTVKF
jgi:hypothetical protein